jgi:hypothetical protein
MTPWVIAAFLQPLFALFLQRFVFDPATRWIKRRIPDGKFKALLLRRIY